MIAFSRKQQIRVDRWRLMVLMLLSAFLLTGCLSSSSTTTTSSSLGSSLTLIMQQSVAVFNLMVSFCYISGVGFIAKGLYDFKAYGEQRTSQSQQTTLKTPLTHLLVGVAFLYAPTSINILTASMMGDQAVCLAYVNPEYSNVAAGSEAQITVAVLTLLQICGMVSFIRGFYMLSMTHNGGQGGLGKGITHVLAGILLLNLPAFMTILDNSV